MVATTTSALSDTAHQARSMGGYCIWSLTLSFLIEAFSQAGAGPTYWELGYRWPPLGRSVAQSSGPGVGVSQRTGRRHVGAVIQLLPPSRSLIIRLCIRKQNKRGEQEKQTNNRRPLRRWRPPLISSALRPHQQLPAQPFGNPGVHQFYLVLSIPMRFQHFFVVYSRKTRSKESFDWS